MWDFAHFKYQSIRQRDNDEEKIDIPLQGSQQRNGGRPLSIVVVLTPLLAFILGMMLQSALTKATSEDLPHERSWAQSLQSKTSWARFRGRLYAESPYRGNPSKSIDDAWGRFTDSKWFDGGAVVLSASEDDIRRSWKDGDDEWFNSTVRLDERNGGGYMATLEVFHQLHCLNMLRKYSYQDQYSFENYKNGNDLRGHLDHCIDMIRQVLMCHADTGLVLFHWIETKIVPVPDFSTWHKCRDPEDVLRWAQEHAAPVTHYIRKPDGAIAMPNMN